MPTSPSRRAVLAALSASAAAALAGCSTPWGRLRVQPLGGDPPPTTPPPGPDELAVRAAAAAVSAVLAQVGGLDEALAGPLRSALGEQLTALGEPAPSTSPATGAPTSTSTSTSTSSPPGSAPPSTGASSPGAGRGVQQVSQLLAAAATTASSDLADVAGGTARLLACAAAGLDVAGSWVLSATGADPEGAAAPSSSSSPAAGPISPSAGTSPTPAAASGEQSALVAALAVEEAAQYGYGVLAVRLSGAQRDAAVSALGVHTDLVEQLRDDLLALGAAPPAPQPAWALPSPVADAAGALALAQQLEGSSAAAWADVVAAAVRARRDAAADQLRLAAQRWHSWRTAAGTPGLVALPGLSGR
ncbi:DUF4439 domain-containing protein [Quadrisphaera setariae]|uniref:DUF4439 domain-containing protein n=1 Tax=Quadrisphaera setariae TaxID=2593304 RepID=A0A5C8ZDC7_9ACTN|nr:DUF4439 domain-containing protein [Quadrisphaera setariae]TXR55817.1 DUF4439 domain-containing protein [Quadrisphaera setariae]